MSDTQKTALVVSAHSADFVWRAGGAIALYASRGWKVKIVCLSYGERGESAKLWREKGVDFHIVDAAQQKRAQSDQYAKPAFEAWYKAAQAKGIDGRQWETKARKDLGQ